MVSQTENQVKVIEIEKPCCYSARECSVKYHAVIDIERKHVLRYIEAVRCNRLPVRPKYKFYPANNVMIVEHYRSNRGKVYLRIIWKPEGVSELEAIRISCEALGYEINEVLD